MEIILYTSRWVFHAQDDLGDLEGKCMMCMYDPILAGSPQLPKDLCAINIIFKFCLIRQEHSENDLLFSFISYARDTPLSSPFRSHQFPTAGWRDAREGKGSIPEMLCFSKISQSSTEWTDFQNLAGFCHLLLFALVPTSISIACGILSWTQIPPKIQSSTLKKEQCSHTSNTNGTILQATLGASRPLTPPLPKLKWVDTNSQLFSQRKMRVKGPSEPNTKHMISLRPPNLANKDWNFKKSCNFLSKRNLHPKIVEGLTLVNGDIQHQQNIFRTSLLCGSILAKCRAKNF